MVTTYLDELPFGDEDFIRAELNKNGAERRKLPAGCREQVLMGDIMRIAWPSMVELFLASLVGMADMIMVGAMPNGDDAISAVSLANQPKFMFVTLIMALNVGVTAAVARARGAGRHELAGDILRQGLFFSLLISLMASILGLALARPLILFMANDGLEKNELRLSGHSDGRICHDGNILHLYGSLAGDREYKNSHDLQYHGESDQYFL